MQGKMLFSEDKPVISQKDQVGVFSRLSNLQNCPFISPSGGDTIDTGQTKHPSTEPPEWPMSDKITKLTAGCENT